MIRDTILRLLADALDYASLKLWRLRSKQWERDESRYAKAGARGWALYLDDIKNGRFGNKNGRHNGDAS